MLFTNIVLLISLLFNIVSPEEPKNKKHFDWDNATVYFLLTDRFNNGDPSNDMNFGRSTSDTKQLRTFVGGDIKGITQKIEEGYFTNLGVDAIWFSPVNEQIHGSVDEGQGNTYAFHGYWIKDWTAIEPNWGTEQDLKEMMKIAHENNIRVLMDVIINHTGPVTEKDPVWPSEWVRTKPQCKYRDYESTVFCTLVKNLPDIRTDQTKEVDVPKALIEKWEKEGRLQKEMDELDAFFARTGYPRTPRYYIIKWITDYIRKYGIDGFRVDTVKHTEASVWADLAKEAKIAFEEWKKRNQEDIQEDQEFFMLAETYGYTAENGKNYDFGDKKVDYFANGFDSQINFGFKGDANKTYEELFSTYSQLLNNGELSDVTFMNYVSSHDDSWPFDKERERTFESATKLLLSPGQAQIYYGDEIARPLIIDGAQGDVHLRSIMDWEDRSHDALLSHWQKLGKFRHTHPSIGAGLHKMLSEEPYTFSRSYNKNGFEDQIVAALDVPKGKTSIKVNEIFEDGAKVRDAYSNKTYTVKNGYVKISSHGGIILLESLKLN